MKNANTIVARKAGFLIFLVYSGLILINYIFVLRNNSYTGDYLSGVPRLSDSWLFLNFLYSLAPLFILFLIYRYYSRRTKRNHITVNRKVLASYLLISLPVLITASILYGDGRSGQGGVSYVPLWLKPLTVLFNRLDPMFGTFLYAVISPKKDKLKYPLLILLVVLIFSRGSMGVLFVLILLYILLTFNGNIINFIAKRILLVLMILLFAGFFGAKLYTIRSEIRGGPVPSAARLKGIELIVGKIMGRLSSYSNSAMLLERKGVFVSIIRNNIGFFEFPREALPLPRSSSEFHYGHVLVQQAGNAYFSPGIPGVIIIGYYHSILTMLINIITLFTFFILAFNLSFFFRYEKMAELFFLFLCVSTVEGAAGSFGRFIQYVCLYLLFFLTTNFFTKYTRITI
jgi:hypothetical protein